MAGPKAAWIIVYGHNPGVPHATRQRLHRALFGYQDRSNAGRYKYDRPGLLTGQPYRVLRPGVLLVPAKTHADVERVVAEHDAWVWSRPVVGDVDDVLPPA